MTNSAGGVGSEPSLLSSYKVLEGDESVVLELWGISERIAKGVVKDLTGKLLSEVSPVSIFGGDDKSIKGSALLPYLKTTRLSAVLYTQDKEEVAWLASSVDEDAGLLERTFINFEEEKVSIQKLLPEDFLEDIEQKHGSRNSLDELGTELLDQGNQAYQNSSLPDAITWFTKALFVHVLLEDNEVVQACYGSLGSTYHACGERRKAVHCHEKQLKIAKEVGDRVGEGYAYSCLGIAYFSLGIYHRTIQCHEKSLQIAKKTEDQAGKCRAYSCLGIVYDSLGGCLKAIEYYEKGREIAREIGDQEGEACAYGNLGSAYQVLGESQKAIQYHLKCLKIVKETGDRVSEGSTYGNLGIAYHSLGEYRKAIEYHEKHLEITEEVGDRGGEARGYTNLGIACRSLGNYQKAIQHLEKGLGVAKEIEELATQGLAYSNLANVYYSLGDFRRSIEYHEKALQFAKEIGNRMGEETALSGLGNAYGSLGEYRKAIKYHEGHLQVAKDLGDRAGEGGAHGNLGIAYRSLGEYLKAIESHERQLEIASEIGDRAGEAAAYGNIGNVRYSLGDYREAIKSHEKCLQIEKEIGNQADEATTYGNLGNVYHALEDYQLAIEYHERNRKISEEVKDPSSEARANHNLGLSFFKLNNHLRSEEAFIRAISIYSELQAKLGRDEWKISIFEQQSRTYNELQDNYLITGEIEKALEVCERGRARSLFDLCSSRLGLSGEAFNEKKNITLVDIQEVAQRENRSFVYFSSLSGKSLHVWVVKGNALYGKNIELSDIKGTHVKILPFLAEEGSQRSLIADYLPFRIDLSSLGAGTNQLTKEEKLDPNALLSEGLEKLYQTLIAPIDKWLEGESLTIITDASMRDVPFAALYKNGPKGREYLIDKYTVSMAPSVGIFDLLHQLKPAKDGSALVVADPAIVGERLSGAKSEGEALAQKATSPKLLSEEEATVKAVIEAASDASILHFACHGSADARINRDSVFEGALCLTDGKGGKEMLYADEIQKLNLKADLVFLSACQTGKGALRREGVIGLSRAFLGAGVPSVIATHWGISDHTTQEIVQDFYTNFLESKMSKAEALRQTMLKQRKAHPDKPYLWGGFFLVGK